MKSYFGDNQLWLWWCWWWCWCQSCVMSIKKGCHFELVDTKAIVLIWSPPLYNALSYYGHDEKDDDNKNNCNEKRWQWVSLKNTGDNYNVCDSNSHTLSWPPTIYKGLTRLRKIHSGNDNLKHVNMRDDYALLFSLFSSHPLYANISRSCLVLHHPTGLSLLVLS